MNAGEQLMLGSSAIGQGTSDILVWNPGFGVWPHELEEACDRLLRSGDVATA